MTYFNRTVTKAMNPTDMILLSLDDEISFEAPHNHKGLLDLLVTPVAINHPLMMRNSKNGRQHLIFIIV